MKVEIAEHLIGSWLRHVVGCRLVELNWKPSPTWAKTIPPDLVERFDWAKQEHPEAIKGTASIHQFLRQAEIDALGILLDETGRVQKLYAVDSAFHSKGLAYGGNEESRDRVFKKYLRTTLVLKACFPGCDLVNVFAAPKVNVGRRGFVQQAQRDVAQAFAGDASVSFRLYTDALFAEEILQPVLALADEVADSSELFLRAWQLVEPFLPRGQKMASISQSGETLPISAPVVARVRSAERDMGDKSKALLAAYYLSRFDHHRLGLGNQGETLQQLARALDVKKNTLKNQRDFFDSHTGSHREGWKKPMNAAQQAIFNKYARYSEAELRAELEALLSRGA